MHHFTLSDQDDPAFVRALQEKQIREADEKEKISRINKNIQEKASKKEQNSVARYDERVKKYAECLTKHVESDMTLTSSDGGKSMLQLLAWCDDEWKKYVDFCMGSSAYNKTDGDCTLEAGILAQSGIIFQEEKLRKESDEKEKIARGNQTKVAKHEVAPIIATKSGLQQQELLCKIIKDYRDYYELESSKDFYIDKNKKLSSIFSDRTKAN